MLEYDIFINNGNDNIENSKKTITVGTVRNDVSQKELIREIHHINPLLNEQIVGDVIENMFEAIVNFLAEGRRVNLQNARGTLAMFYPDVDIVSGSIDEQRAKEINANIENINSDNAVRLVSDAGVVVRPKVCCTRQFFRELRDAKPQTAARRVVVRDKNRHNLR